MPEVEQVSSPPISGQHGPLLRLGHVEIDERLYSVHLTSPLRGER
jgi:hypothetical protein